MNAWIDRIPALLEAWYPGQEGGTALAQIIFGDVNPSGRLPVSFERRWEDNPVHDSYYPEPGSARVAYREGIFVGYRGYEAKNVKTRFEFGSGLSYSTFQYRSLNVAPNLGYFRSNRSESAARLRPVLRSILRRDKHRHPGRRHRGGSLRRRVASSHPPPAQGVKGLRTSEFAPRRNPPRDDSAERPRLLFLRRDYARLEDQPRRIHGLCRPIR